MQGSEQLKLEDYRVGTLPTLFYIPDFLTDAEQTQLLHHVSNQSIPFLGCIKYLKFRLMVVFFFSLFFFVLVSPFVVTQRCYLFWMLHRSMKCLSPSGSLWRTGDCRIGVCCLFLINCLFDCWLVPWWVSNILFCIQHRRGGAWERTTPTELWVSLWFCFFPLDSLVLFIVIHPLKKNQVSC